MSSIVPQDRRALRACLVCGLVKGLRQFEQAGCDNCEDVLHLRGNIDKVRECTSAKFDGLTALMKPGDSWLARYGNFVDNKPGLYATHVTGVLSADVEDAVRDSGRKYIPRDGSQYE
ncbi:transcription initiation Spt4 [Ramicandelaber brevisporus]|nr:transcription initiation Spt4 [Ramicandelaber brevisporus]